MEVIGEEGAIAHLSTFEADAQTFDTVRTFEDFAHRGAWRDGSTHLHGTDAHGSGDITAGIPACNYESVETC